MGKEFKFFPGYFVFSEVELFSLIFCLILDISEYMVAILIMPVIGDLLDIVGIVASLLMFRWIGIISLLELVPGADILPIFLITWAAWYLLRRIRKAEQERLRKKVSAR